MLAPPSGGNGRKLTPRRAAPTDARSAVRRTERRETLWRAQTPQAFRAEVFRDALRRAAETGFDGTDDASFVEEAGGRVRIVPGDARNVKVTDPTDLLLAEALWLDATGGRRAGKGRPGGGPS